MDAVTGQRDGDGRKRPSASLAASPASEHLTASVGEELPFPGEARLDELLR